eukprot:6027684-Prymnesium_polylepis.1
MRARPPSEIVGIIEARTRTAPDGRIKRRVHSSLIGRRRTTRHARAQLQRQVAQAAAAPAAQGARQGGE